MTISCSSLFSTLLISCGLIFLLNLILTKKKLCSLFCVDFLCVLVCIVVLRLCLPVEFFFTKSVYSSHLMTALRNIAVFKIGLYPLYHILFAIWGAGILFHLIRYIRKVFMIDTFYSKVVQNAKCVPLNDFIDISAGKRSMYIFPSWFLLQWFWDFIETSFFLLLNSAMKNWKTFCVMS